MGRKSVRIGRNRGKTSWWPAVRQHLIDNDERWMTAKQIIEETKLLKYPHKPLLQSRHCPRVDKLSHYLGSAQKDVVIRKKGRVEGFLGGSSQHWFYRWLGEYDSEQE
jgi:hypothetical protein